MLSDDRLWELAGRGDTPFYVYDADVLRAQALRLRAAFPDCTLLYSMKCNPHPDICRLLADLGLGMDTCSRQETLASVALGLAPALICYSAPGKSQADLWQTLGKATLMADSWLELERLNALCEALDTQVDCGLRVSPALSYGPGTRPVLCPAGPDKFGVDEESLAEHRDVLAGLSHVRVRGLHVYVRSQVLDAHALSAVFLKVLGIARFWRETLGLPLDFVNLGGGFGISCEDEDELDLTVLGQETGKIIQALREGGASPRVYLESGRFLMARAGYFVSRILDVKTSRGKTFVIAEGLLNHFMRPALARLMAALPLREPFQGPLEPLWGGPGLMLPRVIGKEAPPRTVTVCGNLCTAQDAVVCDADLPNCVPGNILVFPNAGAYAAALSPHSFGFQTEARQFLVN